MRTFVETTNFASLKYLVGMKPLSERDENNSLGEASKFHASPCRNEATL